MITIVIIMSMRSPTKGMMIIMAIMAITTAAKMRSMTIISPEPHALKPQCYQPHTRGPRLPIFELRNHEHYEHNESESPHHDSNDHRDIVVLAMVVSMIIVFVLTTTTIVSMSSTITMSLNSFIPLH